MLTTTEAITTSLFLFFNAIPIKISGTTKITHTVPKEKINIQGPAPVKTSRAHHVDPINPVKIYPTARLTNSFLNNGERPLKTPRSFFDFSLVIVTNLCQRCVLNIHI